ncbi:MAG: hypothetical protein ABJN42_20400 [Roseibium sp.]|uniref:hypothetical protein n=1 Tax=Roseibium sp. TaxID=1936156 RepID=UPI0032998CA6
MIDFVDIDEAEEMPEEPVMSDIGVIFFDQTGAWHAENPGRETSLSSIGPVNQLDPGLWLSDMSFAEVRGMTQGLRRVTMKADGWIRMSMPQLLGSWGLNTISKDASVKMAGKVIDRIFRLSQEVIFKECLRSNQDESAVILQLERASSLATGITGAHNTQLRKGRPSEKRAQDHIDNTFQLGIYVPGRKIVEEGTMLLQFSMGRLSHAINVASAPVPAPGAWQIATRGDDVGHMEFLQEIRKLEKPAIFRSVITPDSVMTPDYIEMFLHSGRQQGKQRTRYLGEEILAIDGMMPIEIEQVIVGPGTMKSSTSALLQDLVEVCGGMRAAAASWSAGIVAENILNSAFRSVRGSDDGTSPEAVWLAARDRVLMLPIITALCSTGADLVSAQSGQITVRIPEDPEMLIPLMHVAWECGLHLPLDEIQMLAELGVPIPSEIETFGGNDVDYFLSAVAHQGRRNAMWALDGVMDSPQSERKKKIREIFPD